MCSYTFIDVKIRRKVYLHIFLLFKYNVHLCRNIEFASGYNKLDSNLKLLRTSFWLLLQVFQARTCTQVQDSAELTHAIELKFCIDRYIVHNVNIAINVNWSAVVLSSGWYDLLILLDYWMYNVHIWKPKKIRNLFTPAKLSR